MKPEDTNAGPTENTNGSDTSAPLQPNAPGPVYTPILNSAPPSAPTPPPAPKKRNKRLPILIGGGVVLVLLLVVVGVFGFYLPNKPENVFRTGMNRSGQALEKMLESATSDARLKQLEKSEIAGTMEAKFQDTTHTGKFSVRLDPNKTNGDFEYAYRGSDGNQKITAEFMTQLADTARFPDMFFKVNGIKDFVGDFAPGVAAYDGRWIAVESSYLDSMVGFTADAPKNRDNLTSSDVASLMRAMADVTDEYVFTTDPSKAVVENRAFVGKEKTAEGINSYRYKVGLNKANLTKYCEAYVDRVTSEPGYRKLLDLDDAQVAEHKEEGKEGCVDFANDFPDDRTYHMWIDAKYKLIHKVRVYEEGGGKQYADVGQIFTGGNNVSLFTVYADEQDDWRVKVTFDVDVSKTSSSAQATANGKDFEAAARINAGPYEGEVVFKKPSDAVPIAELLKQFGFDPTGLSGIHTSPNGASNTVPADPSEVER